MDQEFKVVMLQTIEDMSKTMRTVIERLIRLEKRFGALGKRLDTLETELDHRWPRTEDDMEMPD